MLQNDVKERERERKQQRQELAGCENAEESKKRTTRERERKWEQQMNSFQLENEKSADIT